MEVVGVRTEDVETPEKGDSRKKRNEMIKNNTYNNPYEF